MKTNENSFIGVFDSGIGGLSLLPALRSILPNENFLYVSDDAFAPYGLKNKESIVNRCKTITDHLLEKGSKLIIVACNTATTNAIETLRSNYSVPFIGIEPAIKPAAFKSKSKSIGVLATVGTLSSSLFAKTSATFAEDVQVIEQMGSGLVEFIESGSLDDPKLSVLLDSYIKPMLKQNIDTLVLGCTHYPFLLPQLKKLLPNKVQIIDSSDAVALQTLRVLEKNNLQSSRKEEGSIQYISSAIESSLLTFLPKDTKVSMLPTDPI